ncbi:MAG TPA: efflux RND transporter periplasmic adaptor subunit [Sedimentisphaerales bacterium]|nr:efflux RND transporter periplasmic adaptor subunit [Sedimentisphaerales bacterium]
MAVDNKKTNASAHTRWPSGKRLPALMRFLIPLAIIGAGILVMFILVKSRRPPERVEKKNLAPLVEVRKISVSDIPMIVRGLGTVTPKVQVEIVPQVAGNVVYVNQQFKPGGFMPAGQTILRIDPRDYELALRQAQALVADALVKLDLEKAEAQVARKEWQQLNPNTEPTSPLVLREPYVRQAQATLDSAQAQLAKAQLNLERTQLSLPIDVVVTSEKVDLGQFVGVGQSVGVAYGTELVEIQVPLEDDELAWFHIPGNPFGINGEKPSDKNDPVLVNADFAGARHTWTGYVKRTVGQVDKTSRLISVVIEVPEPFENTDSRPPLMPGMFVEVVITGRVLKNAFAVPRTALHGNDEVWVVENDRLRIRSLDIVRTDKDMAYAVAGLDDGAQIAVSALDIVTDGMTVRTQSKNQTPADNRDTNGGRTRPQGTD